MASTVEEDDPTQSSAALCISLNLLGESFFRPEFTHQSFDGEWIRGYQPPKSLLETAAKHSSHAHHEEAKHELQVNIKLSPSCRQCQVDVQVQRMPRDIATRASKRQRFETNDEAETAATFPSEKDDAEEAISDDSDKDSDFEDSGNDSSPSKHVAAAGTTRRRRMPVDEIMQRCSKALPTIVANLPQDDYLTQPLGIVVKEYTRNDMDFVVTLANGADAAEYHHEVQKLALWFIENADDVNLASSEGGGYWKVLYMFRKHSANQYSLVGYLTIFHFNAPFRKPTCGIVARICQVLILPPYQRMGHGMELLKQVYDMAGDDIVEVNVEDPAPFCTLLRNKLDSKLLQESFTSKTPWLADSSYYSSTDVSDPDFFKPLSDTDAVQAGAVACITPRQVQIAHEIYKLSLLPNEDCSEDVQKKYRLFVKKRLARVHREDLGGCATKEEKQAMLAKIFDDTLEEYNKVLKRSSGSKSS